MIMCNNIFKLTFIWSTVLNQRYRPTGVFRPQIENTMEK